MTLYHCNTCKKKATVTKANNSVSRHQSLLTCNKCNICWQVCTTCNLRWCARKTSNAVKHFSTEHSTGISRLNTASTKNVTRSSTTSTNNTNMSKTISFLTNTKDSDLTQSTMPNTSKKFFNQNMLGAYHGVRNLVGTAFQRTNNAMAELEESMFQIRITKFCKTLSHSQQSDFLQILNDSQKISFQTTRLPRDINDANKFYLSSKNAIFQNLPTPTVQIESSHAYISLTSLIDHFLAYKLPMNFMTCDEDVSITNGITSCKEAMKMRQLVRDEVEDNLHPMILYINLWSDDFEPNAYRKNRKSIWIKTVTICPPHDQTTSPMYTYVLAIGRKTNNHDVIHSIYNKELQDLSKCTYRYCAIVKKNIPVVVKILTISADRPERSAINHVLGHNGTTTKRWLYSAYINQDKLPSCPQCLKRRFHNIDATNTLVSPSYNCRTCGDWDYDSTSIHLCESFPHNYPTKQHEESPQAPIGRPINNNSTVKGLFPVKLEYKWLKQGCQFSFHNIYHGVWTKANAQTYNQSIGINIRFSTKIIQDASNLKLKHPNHQDPVSTLEFPPYWCMDINLHQCIDTPMHLLFQGIIKSVIEVSILLLKKHSRNTYFARIVSPLMSKIKAIQCEFCRLETFNGDKQTTLGGWIAENYLGFSRVMICILSQACKLLSEVNGMMGLIEFEFFIQACFCFIARLMTKNHVSTQEIDDYIKLFLTSLHYLESVSGIRENKQYIWYDKANFLSILNLPQQIDQFGKIHNYWEGTCERYIQYVKPFLKSVRNSESYLKLQLSNLQNSHVLNNIVQGFEDNRKPTYERHKSVIIYQSLELCEQSMQASDILLGIIIPTNDNESICCLCRNNGAIGLYRLLLEDDFGGYKYSLWYTTISIEQQPYTTIKSTQKLDKYKHEFCLGIPEMTSSTESTAYTFISKNWTCRKQNGKFLLPTISKRILNKYI